MSEAVHVNVHVPESMLGKPFQQPAQEQARACAACAASPAAQQGAAAHTAHTLPSAFLGMPPALRALQRGEEEGRRADGKTDSSSRTAAEASRTRQELCALPATELRLVGC